ncbi:proteinase inhibitor I3 [Tanacetum coccineum]
MKRAIVTESLSRPFSANSAPSPVLDAVGKNLQTGVECYVNPADTINGGLIKASVGKFTCPAGVGKDEYVGDPLTFTPVNSKKVVIRLSTDVNCLNSEGKVYNHVGYLRLPFFFPRDDYRGRRALTEQDDIPQHTTLPLTRRSSQFLARRTHNKWVESLRVQRYVAIRLRKAQTAAKRKTDKKHGDPKAPLVSREVFRKA